MIVQEKSVDILLVEDDPNDAELMLRAMRQRNPGGQICHVMDGDEALDFIFCSHLYGDWEMVNVPRVILLDLKLRKVSGLEVLRDLKSNERTRCVPVVVLTSSRDEIKNVESYKLGVNSYVIKPGDDRMFGRVIGDVVHYWLAVNQPPHQ